MKRFHISKRFLIGIGIFILATSLLATSGVLAKYIRTAKDDTLLITSKKFYFESNYLTEDNHTYKLNSGTKSVAFELYNYENDLRISEVECTYTVTVASTDTLFTIDGNITTEKEIHVVVQKTDTKIILGDLKDGYKYTVTVTADGGYVKTLSATFEVAPAQNGFYMNVDNTNESYVILTVWTENVYGEIEITVPDGLIPDQTDPLLKNINNYTEGEYQGFTVIDRENFMTTYCSHSYRFFKAPNYNSTQKFTVKMGETDALESNIP